MFSFAHGEADQHIDLMVLGNHGKPRPRCVLPVARSGTGVPEPGGVQCRFDSLGGRVAGDIPIPHVIYQAERSQKSRASHGRHHSVSLQRRDHSGDDCQRRR